MRMFCLFVAVVLARTCRSRNNYSKTNNSFMIVDFHTYPLALWTSSSRKGLISAGLALHLNLSPHRHCRTAIMPLMVYNSTLYAHNIINGLINLQPRGGTLKVSDSHPTSKFQEDSHNSC